MVVGSAAFLVRCTGAFVGMVAQDLTGQGWTADFLRFDYIPSGGGA